MNLDFTGKTVIVTGGLGDIGKHTARRFLEAGANVVVAGRHEKPEVIEWLKSFSENVMFVRCDISNREDDENLVKETVAKFGRVDILVNNAGINGQQDKRHPFHEYDHNFWETIISIDVNGTFHLSQVTAQQMIKQDEGLPEEEKKGGAIVNISSVMGVNPARLQCAFTVAKAGVNMLSRVMALELAPYGIRVNNLCPGSIITEKTRNKFYNDPIKSASLLSHVPMKRPGECDEIAYGVMFLASDKSTYTTGANLIIDGGWQCGFTRDW